MMLGDLTYELANAIAARCRATGARQSRRAYAASYYTVQRLAQPQVRAAQRYIRMRHHLHLPHCPLSLLAKTKE
jgi:hypothetical protein